MTQRSIFEILVPLISVMIYTVIMVIRHENNFQWKKGNLRERKQKLNNKKKTKIRLKRRKCRIFDKKK